MAENIHFVEQASIRIGDAERTCSVYAISEENMMSDTGIMYV